MWKGTDASRSHLLLCYQSSSKELYLCCAARAQQLEGFWRGTFDSKRANSHCGCSVALRRNHGMANIRGDSS